MSVFWTRSYQRLFSISHRTTSPIEFSALGSWRHCQSHEPLLSQFPVLFSKRFNSASSSGLYPTKAEIAQSLPLVKEKRAQVKPKKKLNTIRRIGMETSRLPEETISLQATGDSTCFAYCTARQYNLDELYGVLCEQFQFIENPYRTDDYLHIRLHGKQRGEIFFFKQGVMVSWQATEEEDETYLRALKSAEIGRYDDDLADVEEMNVLYDKDRPSGMLGEDIVIGAMQMKESDVHFAKLAFSHGLARSTQLGVLEKYLSKYLASIEEIPIYMMKGRAPPLDAKDMMQKHGQLLFIRGLLNLHTDLVDHTPEFYWSRHDLAKYFESISRSLDIVPRIKVLNQRLDHADRLVELMNDHLSKKHGTRMEWIIIALIAVEVVFELVHYLNELNYVDLDGLLGNKRGYPYLPLSSAPIIHDNDIAMEYCDAATRLTSPSNEKESV